MVEVSECSECLLHNAMAGHTRQGGDKGNAACVVFVVTVVEALRRRGSCHRSLPSSRVIADDCDRARDDGGPSEGVTSLQDRRGSGRSETWFQSGVTLPL